jgi:hypothetical protein
MNTKEGERREWSGMRYGPLVVAVIAHEVDAWEVQGPSALRALCSMEQSWVVRIRKVLDLLELLSGLVPIRRSQLLVLKNTRQKNEGPRS